MLAPETLYFQFSNATEKRNKLKDVTECINSHSKNFRFTRDDTHEPAISTSLKCVIPKLQSSPNQLKLALTTDSQYYRIKECSSLSSLIFSKDFIKVFLSQGSLWMQSLVHGQNEYFVLRPNGKICMFMNSSTLETLGFDETEIQKLNKLQYMIEVDLKQLLIPDKISTKTVVRWRESLQRVEHLFTKPWILSWQPYDQETCPSSIAKFFHENGAHIEEMDTFVTCRRVKDHLPEIDFNDVMDEDDIDFEMLENWTGNLMFQSGFESESNITVVEAEGMFHSQHILRFLNALQHIINNETKLWALVSVRPVEAALNLKQSNSILKQFSFSSRTLILTQDSVYVRSKRGHC